MLPYQEFEKKVFDFLMSKHQADPRFTFSLRQKASKGAESNYFIGTEKSGYFGCTFWNIPVGFPGSTSDLIDVFFQYSKGGNLQYRFEFNHTRRPEGNQNILALAFTKYLKQELKKTEPRYFESPETNKMEWAKILSAKEDYKDFEELCKDLDVDFNRLLPKIDLLISDFKSKNELFIANRFSKSEFDSFMVKLNKRRDRFGAQNFETKSSANQFWIFAPGQNAEMWQEFYDNGIMAIGFDELGDLNQYNSKQEIQKKYQELYNNENIKGNDIAANFDFKATMNVGDIVIVKKGRKELLGYGQIDSDYYYDENRANYKKCRRVKWLKKGNWPTDHSLVLKTLTNITHQSTDDHRYEKYTDKLMAIMEDNLPKTVDNQQIMHSLNTIFYGPPGTGKTYNTINKALEILGINTDGWKRETIKAKYDEYVSSGQIEFTTFHQSMSYEDFIEGIKPVLGDDESDNVKYEIQDGIFKRLAKQAYLEYNSFLDKGNNAPISFSASWQLLINEVTSKLDSKQNFKLPSLTGKEFEVISITEKGNLILKPETGSERDYIVSYNRTQKLFDAFHDLSKVSNIDKEFRAVIGGSNSTAYWSVLNFFHKNATRISSLDKTAEIKQADFSVFDNALVANNIEKHTKPYILIIDEINRGNVSQIFGELITLIEEDKRLGKEEALTLTLPYSKTKFGVPPNLYIIGTMNTADRSVEALDTALRRRFSFEEMQPKAELIQAEGKAINGIIEGIDLSELLKKINSRIEKLLDRDHLIGHSYFLNISSVIDLKAIFANKIIPLLQEFFFGDYAKIGLILGNGFVQKASENSSKLFAKFDDNLAEEYAEKTCFIIQNPMAMSDEVFLSGINSML